MKFALCFLFLSVSAFAQSTFPSFDFKCESIESGYDISLKALYSENRITVEINMPSFETSTSTFDYKPQCWQNDVEGIYMMGRYLNCVTEGISDLDVEFALSVQDMTGVYGLMNYSTSVVTIIPMQCQKL